jgi:hypothetical protein
MVGKDVFAFLAVFVNQDRKLHGLDFKLGAGSCCEMGRIG